MTEQDVYEKVKAEIESQAKQDKRLNAILKKVNDGKADFNDTAEYSERISNILGNVLSGSVEDMTEFGLKENVCKRLLKDRYSDINTLMTDVQSALDKKSGINLAAKQADFPIDRVAQIAHSLEDPTVDIDTIKRRADSPVANVSKSFHDDYIEENASFRNDAGLKCFIERTSDGKCCPWCSEVAGRYVYGEEPDGTFRRHDNCNCRIVYSNGRVVQTLQGTKKSWEVGNEISYEEYKPTVMDKNGVKEFEMFEPTVLSKEQANRAELNALKAVDKTAESGIIKEEQFRIFQSGDEVNKFFGGEGGLLEKKKSVEHQWLKNLSVDEAQAISDYCSDGYYDVNAYFRRVAGSEYIDANAMKAFAQDLDSAIDKFNLTENITVYRGIDNDALKDLDLGNLVGSIYEDKGYMSTSPIHADIVERRDALLEIQVLSGQGKGAYVNSLSGFKDDEYEFLLKRGTKCEVISVDLSGSKPIIRMKVIDE